MPGGRREEEERILSSAVDEKKMMMMFKESEGEREGLWGKRNRLLSPAGCRHIL